MRNTSDRNCSRHRARFEDLLAGFVVFDIPALDPGFLREQSLERVHAVVHDRDFAGEPHDHRDHLVDIRIGEERGALPLGFTLQFCHREDLFPVAVNEPEATTAEIAALERMRTFRLGNLKGARDQRFEFLVRVKTRLGGQLPVVEFVRA